MTRPAASVAGLLLLLLAACSGLPAESPAPATTTPAPSAPPSEGARAGTPSAEEEPSAGASADGLPPVTDPVSLPALMREHFRPSRLRTVEVLAETDAYTRSQVVYRSGGVRVSGVLLRPRGPGPFPGIVLAHGYIEPSAYVTGQGLAREQDRLVREGYAVLHTDYRGHAASDPADPLDLETRLGYARDVIQAVLALQGEEYVDADRMALLGRSMGGGVVLDALVTAPGLVEAAVLYASVSSRFVDNLRRWTVPERPAAARRLFARHGTPREAPEFYAGLSPRRYFDRVTEPVLMFHGTSDDSCPLPWSRTTHRLLSAAGVDSRLVVYAGEEHAFGPRWEDSIRTTLRFLRRHL